MLEWIDDITAFIFLHDAPQKADILFIPGNGHAEPSEYAAQLYHSGYAPLILPSGRFSVTTGEFDGQKSGARRYEGRFETEWAFMRAVLLANGVPDHAIPETQLLLCPAPGTAITRENWMFEPDGIDQTLGELTRCGSQFHDILREITL